MLHDCFVSTVPKSSRAAASVESNWNEARNVDAPENSSFHHAVCKLVLLSF